MFDTPQIDDFVLWSGAVIGALVVATTGLAALHRLVFGPVRKDIENIQSQLVKNSGTSLRDAVDRTEKKQAEIHEDLRRIANRLDEHIQWHLEEK